MRAAWCGQGRELSANGNGDARCWVAARESAERARRESAERAYAGVAARDVSARVRRRGCASERKLERRRAGRVWVRAATFVAG